MTNVLHAIITNASQLASWAKLHSIYSQGCGTRTDPEMTSHLIRYATLAAKCLFTFDPYPRRSGLPPGTITWRKFANGWLAHVSLWSTPSRGSVQVTDRIPGGRTGGGAAVLSSSTISKSEHIIVPGGKVPGRLEI